MALKSQLSYQSYWLTFGYVMGIKLRKMIGKVYIRKMRMGLLNEKPRQNLWQLCVNSRCFYCAKSSMILTPPAHWSGLCGREPGLCKILFKHLSSWLLHKQNLGQRTTGSFQVRVCDFGEQTSDRAFLQRVSGKLSEVCRAGSPWNVAACIET